ncbi:MAG: ABC transporter ATP-binding protein [Mycobacteriales bacterium]
MSEPANTGDLLVAEHVSRDFGHGEHTVKAVADVSFTVGRREIVSIVGESGSGKTTVARIVLKLLAPTAGTLSFDGHDVTKLGRAGLKAYWRNVQAVFQDPFSAFNQFFTVRRLLERSAKLDATATRGGRIEEALGHVGLPPETMAKRPHQLSGGQRQRVMIARALMFAPKLLVADEATSMLDASLRVNILNVLQDLRNDLGMSILFITHDIGQACYVSDRILVMSKGEIVESGPTDDVIFAPQHEYTRRLLADVPKLHEDETSLGSASG